MGSIPAGDLSLLRLDRETQFSILNLYGFGFEPMWTGLVNSGSPVRGLQVIPVDGGVLQGDFLEADIVPGLVIFFNNDPTRRRRILAINNTGGAGFPSGTITVEWHDDIQLVNNEAVTIGHAILPEPKFSYFEANPTVFTKDGPPSPTGAGVVYTDQTEDPPPHVVMGRNAIIETAITSDNAWWLSDTVLPGDTVGAYQFLGALSATEALVNFANPGTNNLAAAPTYAIPSWTVGNGFEFDGVGDILDTGIVLGEDYTVLVMWDLEIDGDIGIAHELFGTDEVGPDFWARIDQLSGGPGIVRADVGVGDIRYGTTDSSSFFEDDSTNSLFILGVNQARIRMGGSVKVNWAATGWSNLTGTCWLGGINGQEVNLWESNTYAMVIYNRKLTNNEMITIENKMLALTSSTPPPGYIYMDATDSQPVAAGATISSYLWSFSPSGLANATFSDTTAGQTYFFPGVISQRFIISCQVTDSNANSTKGQRCLVFDPDGSLAVTEFIISSITESRGKPSVPATVTITSPDDAKTGEDAPLIDWSFFPENGLILVSKKTWYGTTQKEITFWTEARYTERTNVYYCGYIVAEQESWGADDFGQVILTLETLPDVAMYSLSLTGIANNADEWWEYNSSYMYVAALLHHLLLWHSTFIEVSDWIMDWTDTTKRSAVEQWSEGALLERAMGTAGPYGRLMNITGTAQGEIHVEYPINMILTEVDRNAITTILTLSDVDVTGAPVIRIADRAQLVQITAEGGSSAGVIGSWTPFRSQAQNVKKATGTSQTPYRQLMVIDQTELNQTVGRLSSILNPISSGVPKEIELSFEGEYGGIFSPANAQWVNTGAEIFAQSRRANIRNSTVYNSLRLTPIQVTRTHGNQGLQESVSVIFEVEAPQGLDGRTVPIPSLPPNYTPNEVDINPGIVLSPVPGSIGAYVTGDFTNGVEVYDPTAATWSARNTGLSTNAKKVHDLALSPYWWLIQGSSDFENSILWISTEDGIFTSQDAGKSWIDRTPPDADFPTSSLPAGVTAKDIIYHAIDIFGSSTDVDRLIVAQARYDNSGTWITWNLISTDRGFSWTIVEEEAQSGSDEVKGLDIRIDQEVGDNIFVAYWDDTDDTLYVGKRDTDLAVVGTDESFDSSTEAELDAETYRLEIYTRRDPSTTDNDEFVLAFGEFQKV